MNNGPQDSTPTRSRRTLVTGARGQLGRALRKEFGDEWDFEFTSRDEFDISCQSAFKRFKWREYSRIVNVAAYTAVDNAETDVGRVRAWAVNVAGVSRLAQVAYE